MRVCFISNFSPLSIGTRIDKIVEIKKIVDVQLFFFLWAFFQPPYYNPKSLYRICSGVIEFTILLAARQCSRQDGHNAAESII